MTEQRNREKSDAMPKEASGPKDEKKIEVKVEVKVSSRWRMVFERLAEDEVQYFLNSKFEPMVLIKQDGFCKEWLVNSERFRDMLYSIYFELFGAILKSSDREFYLSQIREECRRGGRRVTEAEALQNDKDVVVLAVMHLMKQNSHFCDRTVNLLQLLRKFQSTDATDEVPIFTNLFSRRLSRLIPVLKDYGVSVAFEHREDGSYCTLRKLDAFTALPDPTDVSDDDSTIPLRAASDATFMVINQLSQDDATEGEVRVDPPGKKNHLLGSKPKTQQSRTDTKPHDSPEPDVQPAGKGGAA